MEDRQHYSNTRKAFQLIQISYWLSTLGTLGTSLALIDSVNFLVWLFFLVSSLIGIWVFFEALNVFFIMNETLLDMHKTLQDIRRKIPDLEASPSEERSEWSGLTSEWSGLTPQDGVNQ